MNTGHPQTAKPHATFVRPRQDTLRALDRAHEQGFRRFLRAIGHNAREPAHRRRASEALVTLMDGLTGEGPSPDYDDPYVAAAYVVKYHLSHCMMAYWSFSLLFAHVEVHNKVLHVCDIGAGTGAARIGLALALSQRKEVPSTIYFHAIEPSGWMRDAGNAFWETWRQDADLIYWEDDTVPERSPIPDADDTLRVVTAFHLSLPWDIDHQWDFGDAQDSIQSARRSIRSALDLVSPDFGLFTANSNKAGSLKKALDDFARGANDFPIPERIPVSRPSRFYTACAEDLGFTVKVPDDSNYPVRTWSRYRFSPPSGILLLQNKRARREERYQRQSAVPERRPERRQQELTHYNRGLAYARKGEYDLAIQSYNQALTLNSNLDPAYYNRGIAYARKGKYRRAESDFRKALTLGYDRSKVEARLAELRQEHERREQAEAVERERQQRQAARWAREKRQRQERERREQAEAAERKRQGKGVLARLWNALRGRN